MTDTDLQRLKEICEAAKTDATQRARMRLFFTPAYCLRLLDVVSEMKRIQKASHSNVSTYGIWIKELCDNALAALNQEEVNQKEAGFLGVYPDD